MSVPDNVRVTQADWDAAYGFIASLDLRTLNRFEQGAAQAFARHREAAEAASKAREAALVEALVAAKNDLLAVGNDYPGSSCQKWCAERALAAWNVLEPWKHCPSTHCERSQECRSPNECSATRAALTKEPDA